jgi:protein subunit release factor A
MVKLRVENQGERVMQTETVIVEIRAAEGGADAKLLVEEQVALYERLGGRRFL